MTHQFRPRKKTLGRAPVTGRKLTGWDSRCSCGWERHMNESKREAQKAWKRHVTDVTVPPAPSEPPRRPESERLPGAKVVFEHDTKIDAPCEIIAYVHCGKCIDEWKADPALNTATPPKDYARTQTGWTREGLQVWCTRHDVNITNVKIYPAAKHDA